MNVEELQGRIVDAAADGRAALEALADEIVVNWPSVGEDFSIEEIIEVSRLPRGMTRTERRAWVGQALEGTRALRRPLRTAVIMNVVDPAGRNAYLVALQSADYRTLFLELAGVFSTREAAERRLSIYGFRSVEEFDSWTGVRTRVRRYPIVEAG